MDFIQANEAKNILIQNQNLSLNIDSNNRTAEEVI